MNAQHPYQDSRSDSPRTISVYSVRKRQGTWRGTWIPIPAESPASALRKFRESHDPRLAGDLSIVDVTQEKRKAIVLFSPAYDYEINPESRPPYSRPQCFALRAPGRPHLTLGDFLIDYRSIPVVRPARISQHEWGVRLNDNQVADLRNHRIVRVRTRKGDRWYAKVGAIVRRTERGTILSVLEFKFRLEQQKCKMYRAWTRHEQQVARGEIPRDLPNEHALNPNERVTGLHQTLPGKGAPSAVRDPEDASPAQSAALPLNKQNIDPVEAQFRGDHTEGWGR
ncbi:MAG: hypothetical protein F4246_03485 [Rhodothermaceae bacterium]|nr:hypothetical protein [Rhodothermaceae bacterium]MXX57643.1 hypothetical protein [Rhodothermaceae bacterium]MYD19810.1 hypothetical protein [Rhodothermaceae bacterium]MYD56060.1 hypothetical protein [Rhodothermaceae bacterium]MYI44077.1 hypothetical protein [Rhodothermaceae bacterium]